MGEKLMPIITIAGEKYRYLEIGETILKGDILVPDDSDEMDIGPGFLPVWDDLIGQDYDVDMEPVVRKTK
jgi:hypothetical protein